MNFSALRLIAFLLQVVLLAGCSFFSQTVDPATRDRVHEAVTVGMQRDEAEAKLSSLDFTCSHRTGTYTGEDGNDHNAERFLQCVTRPGSVSFKCENRDQVVVVVKDDVVDGVEVTRGPSCERP